MKRFAAVAGVGLAALGFLALTSQAFAEGKGASQLLRSQSSGIPAPAVAAPAAMACPKCKDEAVTQVEKANRGAIREESKTTLAHQCPTCENKTSMTGQGKTKQIALTHSCAMAQVEASGCCGASNAQTGK